MRASLWRLSVGLWAALMMILRNCRILMLCLSVWRFHVDHFQTASERHRRRAAFHLRRHNDFFCLFFVLAWHWMQSSGQLMGKQGNVSVNYWLLTYSLVLFNSVSGVIFVLYITALIGREWQPYIESWAAKKPLHEVSLSKILECCLLQRTLLWRDLNPSNNLQDNSYFESLRSKTTLCSDVL